MKILVTGGAGYIGSVLVPALLADDHSVTVLDNFMYNQASLNQVCLSSKFDVVNGDCRDPVILHPLITKADVFIPLAALVGAPLCFRDQTGAVSTNYTAILNAMLVMSKDQPILIPISNSGYGIGEPGKACTEESPLKPISLYGQTKVDAEKAVMDRGNAISFRLATVFGMSPRMRIDLLVNSFVYKAVTDKAIVLFEADFKRNYIHIRDVAQAFLHGIYRFPRMKDQIYNVGLSSANLSKRELCQAILAQVPGFTFLEAPVGEDPDKRDYIVSNAKMEATGWRPKQSLDDGIRELVKGYRMLRNTVYGNV